MSNMFAVPGWSITAPLKPQTAPPTVPSLPGADGASGDGNSKKRKRDTEEAKERKKAKAKAAKEVKTAAEVEKAERKQKLKDADRERRDKKRAERGPQEPQKKVTGSNVDTAEGIEKRLERERKWAEKEAAEAAADAAVEEIAAAETEENPAKKSRKQRKDAKRASEDGPVAIADVNGTSAGLTSKPEPGSREAKDKSRKNKSNKNIDKKTATEDGNNGMEPTEDGTIKTTKQKSEKKKTLKKAKLDDAPEDAPTLIPKAAPKLTPLQAQMAAKLGSARFRHLNEKLYTTPSATALDLFKNNPDTFEEYHSGFRQQVEVWPSNPVDGYIEDIKRRGAVKGSTKDYKGSAKGRPLPRTAGACLIADLGCGDAKLASDMSKGKDKDNLNIKILSYDLHSPSKLVTRADIAHLPLEDGSVNVAIFCLALMGTNWPDFIDEAYRILHWKGELWIAEIKSRFGRVETKKGGKRVVEHSVGNRQKKPRGKMSDAEKKRDDILKQDEDSALAFEVDGVPIPLPAGNIGGDETDVSAFVKVLATRGFLLDGEEADSVERGNKMFVKMRFVKAAHPTKGKNVVKGKEGATWKPKGKKFLDGKEEEVDEGKVLKPCVYKLR